MDYNEILSQLDNLYNTGRMEDAGAFLEEQYALAVSSGEPEIALGILNVIIVEAFSRRTSLNIFPSIS